MNFDGGNTYGRDGIPESHAGVSVGGSVEDDGIDPALGLLNPSHQLPFYIGLTELDLRTQGRRPLPNHPLDVLQRDLAINSRLALAEQIQIRTIENQDLHS